ncbi:very-long-chain aldehyde decarbonylase GL1-6-like [Lycium ferocissimum]|uniref:very-long-chain aldehyde decarbonylase GL1-6-like n=1 Tax=Lycium ferocissimum TaxID=112874 RepID=UPI002815A424|nr:very-long-chain aldehyde decarbonylase GL1-6-like [Lycium ferocissimum]
MQITLKFFNTSIFIFPISLIVIFMSFQYQTTTTFIMTFVLTIVAIQRHIQSPGKPRQRYQQFPQVSKVNLGNCKERIGGKQRIEDLKNWLPRKVMSAWRIAGILHALEGWQDHECGNMLFDIYKVWKASVFSHNHPY